LPVYDELCLRFVRSCMVHQLQGTAHAWTVGCNIQRCAQRYACTMEDLLLRVPVRSVVTSCVRKSFTDDQFQIAYLLKECVMVRDGLAILPDCYTAGDM